jgi:hypothetical protein
MMGISLAAMVERLQRLVPARNGVPSVVDYEQHVRDAVQQLSMDVPRRVTATLNVIAGTATYTLPADCLYVVVLPKSTSTGVIVTDAGIVFIPDDWREEINVVDGALIISPTPTFTHTRSYVYAGGYALDNGSYVNLNENAARIALLYAQYLALTQQANVVAGDGWKYSIGDESVDKTGQASGLRQQADAMLMAYRKEVQTQRRSFGVRSWA